MAIADQQDVAAEHRWQAGVQPGLGQLAQARNEIDGLTGAVTRYQDTDLLIGDATRVGAAMIDSGKEIPDPSDRSNGRTLPPFSVTEP